MTEKKIKKTDAEKSIPDTLKKRLLSIQCELKAPKNQINNFGKYKYRNAEDILEAVKPLLEKYNCLLSLSDEIMQIGDRYYLKATATIYHLEDKEQSLSVSAYAREPEIKKGMDESQVTGAASSYARKYALGGLFAIDDTKDADYYEAPTNSSNAPRKTYTKDTRINQDQINEVNGLLHERVLDEEAFYKYFKIQRTADLTQRQFGAAVAILKTKQVKEGYGHFVTCPEEADLMETT